MVQRNSEALQLNNTQNVRAAGSSVGNARTDLDKYRESSERAAPVSEETSSDRILGVIAGIGGKLAEQAFQQSVQEAYLSGAAQAGTARSEAELEANPLTRAWVTGGYRDTMGRVAIAENEARVLADMPKLREKTPEQFNEYLAERRASLMPQIEGMTQKQREGVFQNLLLNDRAAIKKHTVEHAKFQIEVESNSVRAAVRVKASALDGAKGDVGSYDAAGLALFSTLQSAVVGNEKLPVPVRGKMVKEFVQYALQSDHQRLYTRIRDEQIPLPDGSTGSMFGMLEWDDQVQLSKAFRESENRTEGLRSMSYKVDFAAMRSGWDDPDTPMTPYADFIKVLDEGTRRGFISPDKVESTTLEYLKAGAKKTGATELANAYAHGDSGKLISMNKTEEEALTAWKAVYGRKLTPPQLVDQLMVLGVQHGRPAALRELGNQLAPAMAQLGMTDAIDPANAGMIAQTIQTLDRSEREGQTGLFASVMAPMPADSQAKMMYIREGIKRGLSPTSAFAEAHSRIVATAQLSPQERVAMGEASAKDNVAIVNDMTPTSLLDRVGLGLKSLISSDAANRLTTATKSSWFEDPTRVAEVGAGMKLAMLEELRAVSAAHPYMDKDSRQSSALASLAARTVNTESGPFVIPRSASLQSYFGVPSSTGAERVGKALDEFVKPADGNRVVYSVQSNKEFRYKELNSDGKIVRDGVLDPKSVAPMVKAQQDRDAEKYRVTHGGGTTKNGFTFNGDNTAGLDNAQMYEVRSRLLSSENVRVEGSVPTKFASDYFMRESDKAARAALLPMKTTGRNSQEALSLFTELAFRTEGKFTSQKEFRPFLTAMREDDPAKAIAALSGVPLYKEADAADKARLAQSITKVIKGM